MKFEISKLSALGELDVELIAIWPSEVRIVVAMLVALISGAIGYFILINPKLPVLDIARQTEQELKHQFEAKYRVAANVVAYNTQLAKIKEDFTSMLQSLPTNNETPGLLDDITYIGTSCGLKFQILNWLNATPNAFYTELPIEIEVHGSYHDFGAFVSGVARLPRIVTLHDFEITKNGDALLLKLQAKTYRAENSNATEGN